MVLIDSIEQNPLITHYELETMAGLEGTLLSNTCACPPDTHSKGRIPSKTRHQFHKLFKKKKKT